MSQVYAKWVGIKELPEDLNDIHVSCGVGEDQVDGFTLADEGATLTVKSVVGACGETELEITFTAPSGGIEKEEGFWLSPSLISDETEAEAFGIRN